MHGYLVYATPALITLKPVTISQILTYLLTQKKLFHNFVSGGCQAQMCKNSLTVYEKLRASKANMQKHLLYEQGRNLAEKKTHNII